MGRRTATHMEITSVVELEVENPRASFFVGRTGANRNSFVDVYGALAPLPGGHQVKILSWKRYDRFRQCLLESEALEACRMSLERAGFSSDLDRRYGIGPGKMFVRPEQAWSVLLMLYRRYRQRPLRRSDVIVSREFEDTVKDLVHANAPRPQ